MQNYLTMLERAAALLRDNPDAPEIGSMSVRDSALDGPLVEFMLRQDEAGDGVFEWARRLGSLVRARACGTYIKLEASLVTEGVTIRAWTHVSGRGAFELLRESNWLVDLDTTVYLNPVTRVVVRPEGLAVAS
ncbi:hypothetical protein Lesp02_85330 [Lentzea sp. NBRC 105346]|uniref:hypothetical protein n=1 Tax=Lentzea sp. NBRC 105346 TaxID=3032205 RepID=UPI0024A0219C|nr:hypothetical protein [Lentzea sp. NBRC 105346]GLZ36346.1 hypothetical protein Lesp02_85330 [Lentzea sp. NBRC 105346]